MSRTDRAELREVSAAVLAVTAHLSVREVLDTILAATRRLLDAQYAALGVPDRNGSFRVFLAAGLTGEQWRAIGPVPQRHGLLGDLLTDPNPVRLTDVRGHPHFSGWPDAHPAMTDFLGIPIVYGTEILGELFLANKRTPGGFTAEDEELGQLLAGHAAIAIVNARLYERSRELSIVEERNRIARELHDSVTQKLFSLRLTAEAVADLLSTDPGRAGAELATVQRLAAEAGAELRAIVAGLQPTDLTGAGLDAALRKQIELLDRVHEPAVRFTAGSVPRLRADREEAAYRIAQEAVHNALRHAAPTRIDVTLGMAGAGTVELSIVDDGVGFDPDVPAAPGHRLGLASMRERARMADGRLRVESRPGGGTSVRVTLSVGER